MTIRKKIERKQSIRRVAIQRKLNLQQARETAATLLWMKAVIERNQREGRSLGC